MDAHAPYRLHHDAIESAIRTVCRRFRLPPADADDFAGDFRLRLVSEDYARLKRFEGRSSLRTFLIVVVTRAFQDWRNARWGKWRPSAEAKRLGPLAERVERLVARDGHTLDEAHEILATALGTPMTREAFSSYVAPLTFARRRMFVPDDELDVHATPDDGPEAALVQQEAASVARRAAATLAAAVGRLPAEDRLVLRLRFEDCLTLAEVARTLRLDQKSLYRRVERLLTGLRGALEADGLSGSTVQAALDDGGFALTEAR